MRRTTTLLLFAALFVAELGWSGISPLLPTYQDQYGLTDVATGLIVSLAGAGILIVSLPVSGLTNRFSVRSLTLCSLGVLAMSNLVVGLSGSYPQLLVGRITFGVGLGMIWVTGTTWLHDASGEHSARALALTTSVVGVASLLSPPLVGWLGETFAPGTPFIVLALLCASVLIILSLLRTQTGRRPESNPSLHDMLRAARGDRLMVMSLVLTLAVALAWMSVELLVPLRLDAAGFDASRIGLAFAAASIVFIVASVITSARAERYATARLATVWTAAFALTLLIAAIGVGVTPTVVFLVAAGVTSGVLVALSFPLGAAGAARRWIQRCGRRRPDQCDVGGFEHPGTDPRGRRSRDRR